MKLPRFFAPRLEGDRIELGEKESRHALKTLRLQEGQRILIFDDRGEEREAEIVRAKGTVQARIIGEPRAGRELSIAVTAACAVPKGRRLEFMVQKLAELGAERFVPVTFQRTVARLGESKRKRCEQIAVEAAKQCGRASLMRIDSELPLDRFLEEKFDVVFLGDPRAPRTLFEELQGKSFSRAAFLVGPEGGLTDDEAARSKAIRVRLAPTILRVETAAVAMMATLAQR